MDNSNVLQTSGPISLSTIGQLYGLCNNDIRLSRLYANGFYGVGQGGSSNVPTTGPISLTNFYGAKRRSDTIATHPPNMTTFNETINGLSYSTYFAGTYGQAGWEAWRAFDSSLSSAWMAGDNLYSTTTGLTNSTTLSLANDGYFGNYIGITLPINVYAVSYELAGNMKDFRLYAQRRDNPGVWDLIDSQPSGTVPFNNSFATFQIPQAAQDIDYYRFVIAIRQTTLPNNFGRSYCYWFRINGYPA